MRIALTHNLRLSDSEDEAEFDSKDTVDALAGALERLGHRVERIEVSGPASRTVARLEAYSPDLIFNAAEGRRGRFREAFFPALFEELGMPYTGSDSYALTVSQDKQLAKMIFAQQGLVTPRWQFVDRLERLDVRSLPFPVIVKPNFEGSSKGIGQDSVIEDPARLPAFVAEQLRRYPAGLIVEQYVPGRDISVPYLGALADGPGKGILTPIEYVVGAEADRRYPIFDYETKSGNRRSALTRRPAELGRSVAEAVRLAARRAFEILDCRDLGSVDFRVTPDGAVHLLEINLLPSLEPGSSLFAAAALEGLHFDGVLDAVIKSATKRYAIKDSGRPKAKPRKVGPLKVGFAFNVKRVTPTLDGQSDSEAEYDSPKTLQAIREAIASYGHEVVDLEATSELPTILASSQVDVVFNIAEGLKGRNRESQVPALLELLDIPYTGSDPAALSITLDKGLAKRMVRTHGILTPQYFLMQTGKEKLPRDLRWPLMVKPVAEGSSKGVISKSVCDTEAELREVARELAAKYRQHVLVEEYILGREFTVGLLGERRPRALPPMEIVFLDKSMKNPIYSFEMKQDWDARIRYDTPAQVDDKTRRKLEECARDAFVALGCRDVARIDFRMDDHGRIYFLECNPLPGLTPGWSDLVLISQAAGMDYRTLIGEILSGAIRRYKERVRERRAMITADGPRMHRKVEQDKVAARLLEPAFAEPEAAAFSAASGSEWASAMDVVDRIEGALAEAPGEAPGEGPGEGQGEGESPTGSDPR
ncbi:D-alanine--D-alanine ligase family protein [Vulgatibacter incomptus]|uniref:D-alanine-D-alanine ligase n=1 Tax=Vulgatibacter incomptus TaxID=1391653 RepID=A0A0K1PCF3_9BACT|nr:ATP-grasp domain-containing protein [Vulgatibacter incomptus]AKU91101.1 D-alanine-D-alanine ligase [Vulgatibacter incomptus]